MNTGNKSLRLTAVAATVVLTFACGLARADPPGRVARLAYVNGAVSFAPTGSDDWVQASVNRPLMPGDRLWVDPGGRDEVQIGSAALRMDGGTLVSVLSMDDRKAQFQLTQGRAYLRVRRLDPGEVMEVDTPNLALSIRKPGVYRLEVDPNGNTTAVAVRSGQAEAYGDGNAYLIDPGQAYRFGGTNLQDYQLAQMPPDDDFERWSAQRDLRRDRALARRYVSPELVGYEDLDDNGSWREVPNYGSVWIPANVAPDWAPYRDGHWSWIDPWGWTWVDDAPWGFTVSHYGRWTHLDAGWGWVPGPPVARPVYAPALVAFVAGAALALELDRRPAVAWFPLGPREVYRPTYQASPRYITNVNVSNTVINRTEINKVVNVTRVTNVTNVTNVNYVNRQVPGAVTAVPTQTFVRAQPVRPAAVPLSRQALARAPVTNRLALAPQAASRSGDRPAGKAPVPVAAARQVIAHTAPQLPVKQKAALPHGLQQSGTAALAAAAPQVKVVPPPRAGKPLAPPPPPSHALTAAAPQQGTRPANALPQVARPPEVAQHPQAARPPELTRQQQAAHSPEAAHPPQAARPPEMAHQPQIARPPEVVRPPQIAAQPPRPQPPQHAEPLPHAPSSPVQAPRPLQQARAETPHPPAAARPEPPRPQPPRDLPHQMAQAKPSEPRPQPAPAEAHRPPPAQAAAQEHHAPPEKDKHKEERH